MVGKIRRKSWGCQVWGTRQSGSRDGRTNLSPCASHGRSTQANSWLQTGDSIFCTIYCIRQTVLCCTSLFNITPASYLQHSLSRRSPPLECTYSLRMDSYGTVVLRYFHMHIYSSALNSKCSTASRLALLLFRLRPCSAQDCRTLALTG